MCLVERILERKLPRRCGSAAKETLTVFQFWSYLEAEGVSEMETHITELAEEGMFYICVIILTDLKVQTGSSCYFVFYLL